MKTRLLFTVIFLPVILLSNSLEKAGPSPVCGLPKILAKSAVVQVTHLLQKPAAGDTSFYIWDNINADDAKMIEVVFRKLRETGNIIVYAEVAEIEADRVSVSDADKVINALLYETPSGSINPNKGILANEIEFFGQLPDVGGNGKLLVLLIDVRDDYEPGEDDTYVAGYFDPRDQLNLSGKSNLGDIIYIDTNPGKIYDDYTLGVVAHELQHLIHHGIDSDESLWLNEGFSEFASFILGFDFRPYSVFLRDTNRPLTSFDNSLGDYAKVGLWTHYAYRQFGIEFLKDVISESANSLESYSRVLSSSGYSLSIAELMRNWFIANLLNDPVMAEGIYSYKGYRLSDIYSKHFYGSFPEGQTVDAVVKNSAAQYIQFYAGKDIRFEMDYSEDSQFFMAVVKQGDNNAVEFRQLDGNSLRYSDPQFGVDYTKITFIPYWTRVSMSDLSKSIHYSAQLVGGIEESEILFSDELLYYIRLEQSQAVEKFTVPGDSDYNLAGVKFQVGKDTVMDLSIYLSQTESAVVTYEIVPSVGEMTNYYLPVPIPVTAAGEFYIALGSRDSDYTMGYSDTGAGVGRAYLKIGNSFVNLNNYKVDDTILTGDWIIGAILHKDIIMVPEIEITPDELFLWSGESSKSFQIHNRGSAVIDWWINSDLADWLNVSPMEGSDLATVQEVTVTAERNFLEPGIYNNQLVVASTGGTDSLWISVLERNLYSGQAVLYPSDLSFIAAEKKKKVQVFNIGNSATMFHFESNDPALVIYPESGVLEIADTVTVSILIDPQNIQSKPLTFSFFNGIDTLDFAVQYRGELPDPIDEPTLFPVIPNPYIASAGGQAEIRYRLLGDFRAILRIYNVRGETIRTIQHNQPTAGLHLFTWDGKNQEGHKVSSGVYFLVLRQNGKSGKGKMLLLN